MQRHKSDSGTPRLVFLENAWARMMAYISSCPIEINGLGTVAVHAGQIVVTNVFILDQNAGPGHAEIDDQALARFNDRYIRQGGNIGDFRFQWHSHVKGPAFFSSEDEATIDRWAGDWLVSLVGNHYGEYQCRLDVRSGGVNYPLRVSVPMRPVILLGRDLHMEAEVAEGIIRHVRTDKVRWGFGRQRGVATGSVADLFVPPEGLLTQEEGQ